MRILCQFTGTIGDSVITQAKEAAAPVELVNSEKEAFDTTDAFSFIILNLARFEVWHIKTDLVWKSSSRFKFPWINRKFKFWALLEKQNHFFKKRKVRKIKAYLSQISKINGSIHYV